MSIANTWRWLPNWQEGITERLEWRTDVQQSYDGTEQRYTLRAIPRRIWSWQMTLTDRDRELFEVEFYRAATSEWLVPLWWDVQSASLSAGATSYTRPINPDDRELPNGGYLVIADRAGAIGKGPVVRTTGTVGGVASVSYSWTGGLARSFPGGRVYAGRLAQVRIDSAQNVTSGVTIYSFTAEATGDFALSGFVTSEWDRRPNRIEPLDTRWEILQDRVDFGGAWRNDVRRARPLRGAEHAYLLRSRLDAYTLRQQLTWLAGQCRVTIMPTFGADLTPTANVTSSGLTVAVVGWTTASPNRVAIVTDDGVTYRTVTGSFISGAFETLTLSPPITSTIPLLTIRQVSWAGPSRLAADAVEIIWRTPEVADVSLSWLETV
jgi:hypothetical protein